MHMTRDNPIPISNQMYLLVDAAQYPGIWRVLQYRFRRLQWLSLYEETTEMEDAVHTGPVLIKVTTNQTKTLAWFLDHTQDIHGLSWLLSPLSLVELRGHLNSLMQVVAADSSEYTMRFFDTRILPVWYEVLSYEQKLHAFGPITNWSFLNREGMECTLKGKAHHTAPLPKCLRLTPAQEDAMLSAAMPDLVIQQLENTANPDLAAMPGYQRYGFIVEQIDRAKIRYGLQSLSDIVFYCTLALSIGENFDQLQSVAEILQNYALALESSQNGRSMQSNDVFGHRDVPISLLASQAESANSPGSKKH
jgi:hypothetical protein